MTTVSIEDWTHDRVRAKNWTGQPWKYAHAKLDGFRLTMFKQISGRFVAYGRDPRPDLEYSHRFEAVSDSDWFAKLREHMPEASSVDGEVWLPGHPASDVPTALRDACSDLRFTAFAVPWWAGVNAYHVDLYTCQETCRDMGIDFAPVYEPEQLGLLADLQKQTLKDRLCTAARERGIEGWVLKQYNYAEWYKVKEARTLDGFVIGTKEGNGKFIGLLGSLEVAVYDGDDTVRPVARVSGMNDAERVEMTEMEDDGTLLGRVCEIAYQYVGAGGRLRHPRFKRWRPDKPKDECTAAQLET